MSGVFALKRRAMVMKCYELHWSLDTEPILGDPIMGRLNLVELIQVIRLSGLLVGGDWNMAFMTFHIVGIIIPTDELIFFRGVGWNHQPVYITYIYLLSNSQTFIPSRAFQLLFLHRRESVAASIESDPHQKSDSEVMDRSISSTVPTSTRDLGWWSFRGIIRCWKTLRSVRFFFQLYKLYTVNVHSCSYICTWDTLPSSCLLFHSTCSNAAPAAPVLWTLVALWASWLVSLIWFWSKHQGAQAATLKWILKSFSTFTSAEECVCLAAQLLHVEHTNGWGAKRATHGTQLAATNLDVVVAPSATNGEIHHHSPDIFLWVFPWYSNVCPAKATASPIAGRRTFAIS